MNAPIPQELLAFIERYSKFIIVGHEEPDGDCVGSQLALSSALERLGKETVVCSAGPFKRPEIIPYQERFLNKIGTKEREEAAVIIMDCSMTTRVGGIAEDIADLPTAVIDHHAAGEQRESSPEKPVFLDPHAPSVTFMTLALIETLGLVPTPEEAKLLFLGLCTDTGFFRHVDAKGSETFARAARLIKAGASPKETFRRMNGGKPLASRQLLGILLARTKSYYGGKLFVTTEDYGELQYFGLESRDSDALYQLLLAVEGVEVVTVVRQESPAFCTAGLRSIDKVDVSAIAASFGGGGHKNAAGLKMDGTLEIIVPRIIAAFEQILS